QQNPGRASVTSGTSSRTSCGLCELRMFRLRFEPICQALSGWRQYFDYWPRCLAIQSPRVSGLSTRFRSDKRSHRNGANRCDALTEYKKDAFARRPKLAAAQLVHLEPESAGIRPDLALETDRKTSLGHRETMYGVASSRTSVHCRSRAVNRG